VSKPPATRDEAQDDLAAMLVVVEQLQPALQNDQRAGQVAAIRRLIDLRAPMGEQWQALADVALRNGEPQLARRAIDLFVLAQGGTPRAIYAKASVLERCGDFRAAYDLVRELPAGALDPAAHAYSWGTAALYLGKAAEAREQLKRAVSLRPQWGQAWLMLAQASDLDADPEIAEIIIAAERAFESVSSAQSAPYYYALGAALAARGDHAGAFAAFERGGRKTRTLAPYDAERDRRDAEDASRGYTAQRIAALGARQTEPTGDALFVTGLPRSGTTLVEQALSRHGTVSGGGESNLLFQLVRETRGQSFDRVEQYVADGGAASAARLWKHLLAQRFPAAQRVVDKSLNTTRFLGLAAAVLPAAPLVWMTRDPLDQAWSCFRTYFHGAQQWSNDLAAIAHHFRLEDELLRRWRDILGDRLLVVRYEELVDDFAGEMGRIAEHCGLALEPAMLSPQDNDRAVTTASVQQVRRPLNRAGIGAAAPYRDYLTPFAEAYGA